MAIVQNWLPASRENYETLLFWWKFYPLMASLQWVCSWYGMGKTSVNSRFNIPGRIAWLTMEVPGFMTLLYYMKTLPAQYGITDLPWQNKVLAGLFVIHYTYRAIIFPLIQPSMSPIHAIIWINSVIFQVCNGSALGGWLAAYGPTTREAWAAQSSTLQFAVGLVLFYVGLTGNYFSDEELREIRRNEMRRQEKLKEKGQRSIEKHYEVPDNGLFKYMLYPHYFMEWVEWLGYWTAAGFSCAPARCFLLNEVFAMLPRAVSGRKWYKEKFGEEKIKGNPKAFMDSVKESMGVEPCVTLSKNFRATIQQKPLLGRRRPAPAQIPPGGLCLWTKASTRAMVQPHPTSSSSPSGSTSPSNRKNSSTSMCGQRSGRAPLSALLRQPPPRLARRPADQVPDARLLVTVAEQYRVVRRRARPVRHVRLHGQGLAPE
ncbi:hypothetical protein DL769_001264 [Monosporascus sp. CRB-8-3]|nr:hypothetical protein DL769_001264 [Monosporascus sp. CRB-8-3]